MKSTSQGIVSLRIRSAMKKTAPLRTPISSRSRPAYSAEISSPRSTTRGRSRSSSMRTSDTPRSSSVCCDTLDARSFRVDDARNCDHVVSTHDERPRLAGGTGDLRVDEHVLDLLRPPSEPIAGTPGPYLTAW